MLSMASKWMLLDRHRPIHIAVSLVMHTLNSHTAQGAPIIHTQHREHLVMHTLSRSGLRTSALEFASPICLQPRGHRGYPTGAAATAGSTFGVPSDDLAVNHRQTVQMGIAGWSRDPVVCRSLQPRTATFSYIQPRTAT